MRFRILLLLAFVGITAYASHAFGLTRLLEGAAIAELLDSSGSAAPLAFVGLMASVVLIAPLPSLPLDIAAGHYFGWFAGGIYAAAGATLGATAAFLLARTLGQSFVRRVIKGHAISCPDCSDKSLVSGVFISRLIPFVSFDVISYGAGLTSMRLSRFVLATFFGSLPLTFLYTSVGTLGDEIRSIAPWIALPALLATVMAPRLMEKLFARSPATETD